MEETKNNDILDNDIFQAFATASSHVYIYVCDMKSGLSRWSKNSVEYFNMKSEYLMDAGNLWVEKIHPDDREVYLKDIEAVFSGKSERHCCEYRAMNKDGEYVWIECRGRMISNEDGTPKLFAGMMTRLDGRNKYDALTGLKTIFEFYKYDFSHGEGFVMLVGIDSFGDVIKNYGYAIGDEVLSVFGRRLEEHCGTARRVFRMEGDKFIVISPNGNQEDACVLFDEIRSCTSKITVTQGLPVQLSMSAGAVLYPRDGSKCGQVIVNMEYALSQAKRYSRGKLCVYSPDMIKNLNSVILQRQLLLQCVQDDMKHFEMYCQPIVTAREHKVVSCEMLLRWFYPGVECVNIEDIIKYLEYSGNIGRAGKWVMGQAFGKAKEWQKRYGNVSVGFNVSYLQFKDPRFVEELIETGKEYGIDTSLINIELTESSKIDDFVSMNKIFTRLRNEGYKVSLDDFGIAYSTLLLLRNLPVDFVKIDHTFVRSLTVDDRVDLAIVESVIELCHNLNIGVIVEGIETEEVTKIIDRYPVNFLQGYHFSRPVPIREFENIIFKTYEG